MLPSKLRGQRAFTALSTSTTNRFKGILHPKMKNYPHAVSDIYDFLSSDKNKHDKHRDFRNKVLVMQLYGTSKDPASNTTETEHDSNPVDESM